MRRFLFAVALILMLGLVAYTQRTLSANPQGTINNFSPLVYSAPPTPTPTNTPVASATPTATATVVPQGTGVFKKERSTIYQPLPNEEISACGFIRFYDGTPAYGGPDGFHAEACLDRSGRCGYKSSHLDASGYYQISMEAYTDLPTNGGGAIFVTLGRDDERLSNNYRWDFRDVPEGAFGTTIRMDFIECRVDDPSEGCDLARAVSVDEDGNYLMPAPLTSESPRSPNVTCPNYED